MLALSDFVEVRMTVVEEGERNFYAVYPLTSRYRAMSSEEALRAVFEEIGKEVLAENNLVRDELDALLEDRGSMNAAGRMMLR